MFTVIILYKININMNKEDLINFEKEVIEMFEDGDVPYLLHICGGNEEELINIFKNIKQTDYKISTHRTHYHYLLSGGDPVKLKEDIKRGKSMFIFDKELNFLSTSIVAGGPCIAAGIAYGLKMKNSDQKVWCFLGDGAEDEGHFYEAVRFVDGYDLPCTFVIEDNNRNVSTTREQRMGKSTIVWPSCVVRYNYVATFPHTGTNSGKRINFKFNS